MLTYCDLIISQYVSMSSVFYKFFSIVENINVFNRRGIVSLAERLKLLRKEKNISQRVLANLLGISNSALAMYETGAREPDYATLQKIANYYEETIDYLVGNTNQRRFTSAKTEQVQKDGREELKALIPHAESYERKKQLLEIIDLPSEQFELIYKLAKSPILEEDSNFIKYYNLLPDKDKEKVKSVIKLFIGNPEKF